MINCRETQGLLDAFLDGELPPEQILCVETHLEECQRCNDAHLFAQAVQISTREVVEDLELDPALEERIKLALAAERERSNEPAASVTTVAQQPQPLSWKAVTPLLAVAAAMLFWIQGRELADAPALPPPGLAAKLPLTQTPQQAAQWTQAAATTAPNNLVSQALDYLIDYHSAPPPPQVVEADLIETFESDVGVRVQAPNLSRFGAFWESASIVRLKDQQAAQLRYRLPNHHVTVYVYDPRKVAVTQQLDRKVGDDQAVYVGNWRGYGVAAMERRGVGYALASDLDDMANAELLSDIH